MCLSVDSQIVTRLKSVANQSPRWEDESKNFNSKVAVRNPRESHVFSISLGFTEGYFINSHYAQKCHICSHKILKFSSKISSQNAVSGTTNTFSDKSIVET